MTETEYKTWRRDPLLQVCGIDATTGVKTYARSDTASRAYIIVKVPFNRTTGVEDYSGLSEDEKRFVVHNVTPQEHLVDIGAGSAEDFDRSR